MSIEDGDTIRRNNAIIQRQTAELERETAELMLKRAKILWQQVKPLSDEETNSLLSALSTVKNPV